MQSFNNFNMTNTNTNINTYLSNAIIPATIKSANYKGDFMETVT